MLNTKSIETSSASSKVAPVIKPGNHQLKINRIYLEEPRYQTPDKEYFLMLDVETAPVNDPEFKGWTDPNGNPYQGQIGRVKYSYYSFKNATLDSGTKIDMVEKILQALAILAQNLDAREVLDSVEEETLEAFVDSASAALCPTAFLQFCIGGKEWENKDGYTNYDLFLPKPQKGAYPFGSLESDKILTFDSNDHIVANKKAAREPINSFSPESGLDV